MELFSNLHPIAVHFPIAHLFLYILFEAVGLFYSDFKLGLVTVAILFLGVIGGIVSVITGNLEFQSLQSNPSITKLHLYYIEQHSDLATLAMWYFLGILILKLFILIKKKNKSLLHIVLVILSFLGGYILYKTGEIGGTLVYKYGIGTDILN